MKFPKKERIIALFFAVLFLVTSSTVAVLAIINSIQDSNNNGAASQQATKEGKNMLQGTQLAGFTPVASVPELQIIDTEVGTGKEATASNEVTADYTGALAATGIIFQSSYDFGQAVPFNLAGGVIKGWTLGIPGMKVGGTRRLVIPANLGYAASPPAGSGIPVNADLVFDITLRSIDK